MKTIRNNINYNNSVIKKLESTPQASAVSPQTAVNVVAAKQDIAAAAGGNNVTIAPITNTVVGGAKSGDVLAYRDPRDNIRKAFNQDVFGIVAKSSAFG